MKQLIDKIYFLLLGPLYRRISRDVVLHMQELKRAQLEYQDKFSARVCDQMLALAVEQGAAGAGNLSRFTDDEIIHLVVNVINTSEDLVALSKKHQIPLHDLIDIYSKYGGMDAIAIRRVREMERTNAALCQVPPQQRATAQNGPIVVSAEQRTGAQV